MRFSSSNHAQPANYDGGRARLESGNLQVTGKSLLPRRRGRLSGARGIRDGGSIERNAALARSVGDQVDGIAEIEIVARECSLRVPGINRL